MWAKPRLARASFLSFLSFLSMFPRMVDDRRRGLTKPNFLSHSFDKTLFLAASEMSSATSAMPTSGMTTPATANGHVSWPAKLSFFENSTAMNKKNPSNVASTAATANLICGLQRGNQRPSKKGRGKQNPFAIRPAEREATQTYGRSCENEIS